MPFDELLDDLLSAVQDEELRRVSKWFGALQRARTQEKLVGIRRNYRPFDPDCENVSLRQVPSSERRALRERLYEQLKVLLAQANYTEIPTEELNDCLSRISPRGLVVTVDMNELDELGVFYRGRAIQEHRFRDWRKLYLKERSVEIPIYRRLFLFIKLKEEERSDELDGRLIYLKHFRDVPQSDLEMLLPNTRVRMRGFDKLKLGITGGGGTLGGVMATVTKLAAATHPMTWVMAFIGLGAVIWRQVFKVFAQRTQYMAALARKLYFHCLDNNLGAVVHLVELAQSQEAKETLLAYVHLHEFGEAGATQKELDMKVESYLQERFGINPDYEVHDGMAKLRRHGLLRPEEENGSAPHGTAETQQRFSVVAPEKALGILEKAWSEIPDSPAGNSQEQRLG